MKVTGKVVFSLYMAEECKVEYEKVSYNINWNHDDSADESDIQAWFDSLN